MFDLNAGTGQLRDTNAALDYSITSIGDGWYSLKIKVMSGAGCTAGVSLYPAIVGAPLNGGVDSNQTGTAYVSNVQVRKGWPADTSAVYTWTGSDATFDIAKKLAAGAGSYDVSGSDASLLHAWLLSAEAGDYTWSGTDADLIYVPNVVTSVFPGGGWAPFNDEERKRERKRRKRALQKARELEQTIEEAYSKAIGRPILRKALQDVKAPEEFTPETVYEIGQEISQKLSKAIGTGRRFSEDRRRLEEMDRLLVELNALLVGVEAQEEEDNLAAMLLIAAM
jgi:hypothetical protein